MEALNATNESKNAELQYGDQFRHIITGEVKTVQEARDGKVTWVNGGYDPTEEVMNATQDGELSMYEVEAIGSDCYEGEGY